MPFLLPAAHRPIPRLVISEYKHGGTDVTADCASGLPVDSDEKVTYLFTTLTITLCQLVRDNYYVYIFYRLIYPDVDLFSSSHCFYTGSEPGA